MWRSRVGFEVDGGLGGAVGVRTKTSAKINSRRLAALDGGALLARYVVARQKPRGRTVNGIELLS